MVVGLAKGYAQAQEMILAMIEETFQETGGAYVKEYLLKYKK